MRLDWLGRSGLIFAGWSTPQLLFLLAALAIAVVFCLMPVLVGAEHNPEASVVFRQGGDPDYLPQVTAAAYLEFGETSVKDYTGTGVRSFPFLPVMLHAAFYRLGGAVGFILADIIIMVLYAFLLRLYLSVSGVAFMPAGLLSLSVISGAVLTLLSALEGLAQLQFRVRFWTSRFPRPSVTETLFVIFLILATMLVAYPRRSVGFFALLGISFAAVLQSDIYQGLNAAVILGGVSILILFNGRGPWAAVRELSAMAAAFTVASVPFIYQQLHTPADVKRRWGAFPTSQYRALLPAHQTLEWIAVAMAVGLVLARMYRHRDSCRVRLAALTVCGLGMAASVVSGPASVALLHQAIQINHFDDRSRRMIGYTLLLYTGWLLTDLTLGEAFTRRRPASGLGAAVPGAGALLCFLFCLAVAGRASMQEGRSNLPTAPPMAVFDLPRYRSDFGEVSKVLGSPEFGASVLGTFDIQLADWWQYRRRYVYLVDMFNSTLPDNILEARVYGFLRILSTSPEEFGHLLDQWYFLLRFMGGGKYMANALFTPWPLSDYLSVSQARILRDRSPWRLEVPLSEKSRLITAYRRTGESQQNGKDPDVIVLDKDALRSYVHPEQTGRFALLLSNDTFEVWAPK
jgi:hypothetical protein